MENLHNLMPEDLKIRLEDAILELSNLRFQQATHQIDNPVQLRWKHREIARIKTLLREHELGIRTAKKE